MLEHCDPNQGLLIHSGELQYHSQVSQIVETIETLNANYGISLLPVAWNQVGFLDRKNFAPLNQVNPGFLTLLIDAQFKLYDPRNTSTWQTTLPEIRRYPNLRITPIIGMSCSNITGYRESDRNAQLIHLVEAPRSFLAAAERLDILKHIAALIPQSE
jgi:hypothetical protein